MKVALASGSPRRRDLLGWAGVDVEVFPQDIDETWDTALTPTLHAQRLAERKAASAQRNVTGPRVIIAADTVVHMGGQIFDKPIDRAQARRHLQALSGQQHAVTTGVCVTAHGRAVPGFVVTTLLRFRVLSDREIDAYLATGEADDKAGAYAIQGVGGAFVADVRGSWTNVMGLPLEETLSALQAMRP